MAKARHGARRVPHDGTCSYCDRAFGTLVAYKGRNVPLRLEFDHLVPFASGGSGYASKDNLVASCHLCNRIKGSRCFQSFAEAKLYVVEQLTERKIFTVIEAVPLPRPTRTCEVCKEAFVTGHQNARFCSSECRFEAWDKEHPRKAKPKPRPQWQGPLLQDGSRTVAQAIKRKKKAVEVLAEACPPHDNCERCQKAEALILSHIRRINRLMDLQEACQNRSRSIAS